VKVREYELKKVSDYLAKWEFEISNLNSINLTDDNIISEQLVADVLNIVFDYRLENANSIRKNYPGVDLVDYQNRIAFQISSQKSRSKIQSSIDSFVDNDLDKDFDQLFFIVLGKKQKSYKSFALPEDFEFRIDRHIIDLKDLLHLISYLPTSKIERLGRLMDKENRSKPKKQVVTSKSATRLKRNLSLKKKLQKNLLFNLDQKHWERAIYEPWLRFNYRQLLIRSVDDRAFPDYEEGEDWVMSSWIKAEPWDFYDHGLEIWFGGGYVLFDKEGNWDFVNRDGDKRLANSDYTKLTYHHYARIPYDFMVELDMDLDDYYALPSLYVEYAKDGMPYEKIIPAICGVWEQRRMRYDLPDDKRKDLK